MKNLYIPTIIFLTDCIALFFFYQLYYNNLHKIRQLHSCVSNSRFLLYIQSKAIEDKMMQTGCKALGNLWSILDNGTRVVSSYIIYINLIFKVFEYKWLGA